MFAGTQSRFKPVIEFDTAADGVDGVIFKAGLQSAAADSAGIGVNGTLTDVAGIIDFSSGGISTSAVNPAGATDLNIAIPAGKQASIRHQGRIQFQIHRDSLIGVVTDNQTKLAFLDAGDALAALYYRTSIDAAAGYVNTFSYGSIRAQTTWVTNIGTTPRFDTKSQPAFIVDGSLPEWVTLTISWGGGLYSHLIEGEVVSLGRHVPFGNAPAKLLLDLVSTVLADRTPIRNLILADNPAPDRRKIPGKRFPNIITIGHSFWNTAGGAGLYRYDANENIGSLKHLTVNMHTSIEDKVGSVRFLNTAHDGTVTTTSATVITGHADAMTYTQATTDWEGNDTIFNRYLRHRPDFALLMCHNSDTNTATVDTQLTILLDALKAVGCVPIVIREQNRDAATPTPLDRTAVDAQVQATVATWRAANGGDTACGLVDCWTPTGGSTVNADYVETASGTLHPSLDVGPIYGALVATEFERIYQSLPSWANWS